MLTVGFVFEPATATAQSPTDAPTATDPEAPRPAGPEPGPAPVGLQGGPPTRPMDPWLFFAAIALSGLGLVMVYSASAWLGHHMVGNWEHFLVRQAAFLALGFVGMLAVARLDYRVLRRFAPHLMLAAMAMLVLVLFIGQEVNGARRWIRVGSIGLQPSELAKVALAIFLAATLARQGERVRMFRRGFLPVVMMAGITMLLVLLERDLGTTILLGALTLVMLFIAGTRVSYVAAAVMVAAPIAWQQILDVDYRRGRIEEFLTGDGYQVQQALVGIGSGGVFGLGLGNGRQKLGFLPENHTDFILATIGEELGLVGIVATIGLMLLLVFRGLVIARRASDRFGTYLAAGLSCLFGLQALVNMAVVLEVVPAKGITLPFLSYGGSSLLASMGAVGVMLAISRNPDPWSLSDQRSAARPSHEAQTTETSGPRRNRRR